MPDKLLLDALEMLKRSLEIIQKRAQTIQEPDDFISTENGLTIMDAIAMRLQSVGEKVKKIEQKNPGFFAQRGLDAQPVIRFRDFISHHYEEADYEVLYDICKNHIPELHDRITEILIGLEGEN